MRHALMAIVALFVGVTLLFAAPPQAKKSGNANERAAKVQKTGENG